MSTYPRGKSLFKLAYQIWDLWDLWDLFGIYGIYGIYMGFMGFMEFMGFIWDLWDLFGIYGIYGRYLGFMGFSLDIWDLFKRCKEFISVIYPSISKGFEIFLTFSFVLSRFLSIL